MNRKQRKLLMRIKSLSVRLEEMYCIPTCLYEEIVKTSYDSSETRVKLLMDLCSRFQRTKGYYKLGYPFVIMDMKTCYKLCKGLPL